LVSDGADGTFARVAADLHLELSRDGLQISPSDSGGPLRTLEQILYKPGADVGIVQADAIESVATESWAALANQHLRYLARIYGEEVHVLARDRITSLRELDGLRVNINSPGSGSNITAHLVFEKLGLRPAFSTYETADALTRLRAGEIDAVFLLAPRPSGDLLRFQAEGFHLVEVPSEAALGRSYSGVELGADDYPTLIREGERVRTISVDVVFAVYNWREGTKGFRKLTRFGRSFNARLKQLQQLGHYFAWTGVEPVAPVHGWVRFDLEGASRSPEHSSVERRAQPSLSGGQADRG
jgi:TRAP-type uncharacterized transport system substrate-binding protein